MKRITKRLLAILLSAVLMLSFTGSLADGGTGSVNVYCLDESRTIFDSYTVSIGYSQYVYPREYDGYTAVSEKQYVTRSSTGNCTPGYLVFNYTTAVTPPQYQYLDFPQSGNLEVLCRDKATGAEILTYFEDIKASQFLYAREIPGCTVYTTSPKYIIYHAGTDTCTPEKVIFYYEGTAQIPVAPSYGAQVTVTCRDQNGNAIRSYTESITASRYINPPALDGYRSLSNTVYVTYNSRTGRCDPTQIDFVYIAESRSATLTVNCLDQATNNVIYTYTVEINSSQYIKPISLSGCTTVSGQQYVYYDSARGTCSPSVISFLYSREYSSGTVSVSCVDAAGKVIDTYNVSVQSDQYITPKEISGYRTVSGAKYVTFNRSTGICTPTNITFSYERIYNSGKVTVTCVDSAGATLDTYTVTLKSDQYVTSKNISGYRCVTNDQYVTFNSSTGKCSPSKITFTYEKVYSSGKVTVKCIDDKTKKEIDSYTVKLTADGFVEPKDIDGYKVLSGAQYVVFNSSTGKCNPSKLEYRYSKISTKPTATPTPKPVKPTATPKPGPDSQIVPVTPIEGYVNPIGWDTQFRVGVTTKGANEQCYTRLPNLSDNVSNTRFFWINWTSERTDNIPDLSAFFDNATISGIKTRNGNVMGREYYEGNARVKMWRLVITYGGKTEEIRLTIPDSYSADLREFGFGKTYKKVTRIDFYVGDSEVEGYYAGNFDSSRNNITISDLLFVK